MNCTQRKLAEEVRNLKRTNIPCPLPYKMLTPSYLTISPMWEVSPVKCGAHVLTFTSRSSCPLAVTVSCTGEKHSSDDPDVIKSPQSDHFLPIRGYVF